MPSPSAASKKMTACLADPLAAVTMVARAVAMKSALPRPQPARKPTIWPTVSLMPARADETMMSTSPLSSVRFAPMRLETQPVTSIATPMTAM